MSRNKSVWFALIILISVYRAFLNLIIIIQNFDVIFVSNRIYFIKIILIFLPAILSLLVICYWNRLNWLVGSIALKDVIAGRNFVTAIVLVPALVF